MFLKFVKYYLTKYQNPMNDNSFYNKDEIRKLGLKSVGENVLISRKASIYNPEQISIGNNVRIDDFCILSGNITIENHVHISAYVALYGKGGIVIKDFSGISARTTVYSLTDDFAGENLIGVMVPDELRNIIYGTVTIEKYCYVGAHCLIFPHVTLNEGSVIGAMSLVNKPTESWSVYVGIPARKIKNRNKEKVLNLLNQKNE